MARLLPKKPRDAKGPFKGKDGIRFTQGLSLSTKWDMQKQEWRATIGSLKELQFGSATGEKEWEAITKAFFELVIKHPEILEEYKKKQTRLEEIRQKMLDRETG